MTIMYMAHWEAVNDNMFCSREMLEQSLGELQITVQELQKKVDSVDDESRLNSTDVANTERA